MLTKPNTIKDLMNALNESAQSIIGTSINTEENDSIEDLNTKISKSISDLLPNDMHFKDLNVSSKTLKIRIFSLLIHVANGAVDSINFKISDHIALVEKNLPPAITISDEYKIEKYMKCVEIGKRLSIIDKSKLQIKVLEESLLKEKATVEENSSKLASLIAEFNYLK